MLQKIQVRSPSPSPPLPALSLPNDLHRSPHALTPFCMAIPPLTPTSALLPSQALQKRLITKTEEVVEKDLMIQEKDKLYVELKNILARQPGPEVAEQLSVYQQVAAPPHLLPPSPPRPLPLAPRPPSAHMMHRPHAPLHPTTHRPPPIPLPLPRHPSHPPASATRRASATRPRA